MLARRCLGLSDDGVPVPNADRAWFYGGIALI